MLVAASESAVTKKPRLRLTMRRSSSVRPFGSFHSAMSRLMLISCGIQWLAHAARYLSQPYLLVHGTSWLPSLPPLMTRLSSTRMRRRLGAEGPSDCGRAGPGNTGINPVADCVASAGIAFDPISSSNESMPGLSRFPTGAHWQDSHTGLSMEHNFGDSSSAATRAEDIPPSAETALSCPDSTVDFSAWVPPRARRS